jgi:hypothetical protein
MGPAVFDTLTGPRVPGLGRTGLLSLTTRALIGARVVRLANGEDVVFFFGMKGRMAGDLQQQGAGHVGGIPAAVQGREIALAVKFG